MISYQEAKATFPPLQLPLKHHNVRISAGSICFLGCSDPPTAQYQGGDGEVPGHNKAAFIHVNWDLDKQTQCDFTVRHQCISLFAGKRLTPDRHLRLAAGGVPLVFFMHGVPCPAMSPALRNHMPMTS